MSIACNKTQWSSHSVLIVPVYFVSIFCHSAIRTASTALLYLPVLHFFVKLTYYGETNEWMNEWMSEWVNEWMNEWKSDVCRDIHRKESLNSREWWEKYRYRRGPIVLILALFLHSLLWCCSCYSRLFISIHLQRCTVLQLYERHDGCNNCWSTVCLYEHQCYSGCMQLSRWVIIFRHQL